MTQERLLRMVISVMLSDGFEVSERCSVRPRSFDLIAGKGDVLLIIKVVAHIDSVSVGIAWNLDQIATHLGGVPMIIGEKARDADLERGAVYLRYGIYALNPATLYDYFAEGIPPLVYASPGGLYVNVNGQALHALRERYGLSLGDLAQLLGVSRRTISKYESGMGMTLDVAIRIEEIFDMPLVEPIDLLTYVSQFTPRAELEHGDPLLELERMGLELHEIGRAPFQALALYDEHIILTAYGTAQKVVKRAELIGNISQITGTHAMCILTDLMKEKRIGKTLVIGEDRLHSLEDGAELMDLIID